jgi:hypothetical protein
MAARLKTPGLMKFVLGGALLFAGPALSAAPAGAGTPSEQEKTAALNLQSLQNSEIVNAPGLDPTAPDANPTTDSINPGVPNAVGTARGGGARANGLSAGGGKIGKSRSRGPRGGSKSVKERSSGKRPRG